MKGFNVFLAILIFLLAVTSAVFSFFLFEKRTQLVHGYGFLGEQVGKAAKLLDTNSGTNLAAKLTPEALNHSKYADLPALMPEFISMTDAVAKERDALATALSQLSNTLEKRDLAKEKFMRLDSYKQSVAQLQNYVSTYRSRNDAILNSISGSARQLGANLSVAQLKSSSYASAYRALDSRIAFWKQRDNTYNQQVRNIAAALGAAAPNLSESAYAGSLNQVVSTARQVRSDKEKFYANWQNAERSIKNLQQTVKQKDGKIADLNKLCQKKDNEILRLSRVLGLEVPREPMHDGSADALNLVKTQEKGRVLEVDNKFGFVVVSLGKNTRVQEQFGNRVNNVDPQIVEGAVLTVARNMPSGEAEYINKVKITRLNDNASIAEPMDKDAGKRIKIGDMVYFADDEVAKLVKDRK